MPILISYEGKARGHRHQAEAGDRPLCSQLCLSFGSSGDFRQPSEARSVLVSRFHRSKPIVDMTDPGIRGARCEVWRTSFVSPYFCRRSSYAARISTARSPAQAERILAQVERAPGVGAFCHGQRASAARMVGRLAALRDRDRQRARRRPAGRSANSHSRRAQRAIQGSARRLTARQLARCRRGRADADPTVWRRRCAISRFRSPDPWRANSCVRMATWLICKISAWNTRRQ